MVLNVRYILFSICRRLDINGLAKSRRAFFCVLWCYWRWQFLQELIHIRLDRTRSSRGVRVSGCQCQSRIIPGFDPSLLRQSRIWGAAGEAVLNNVQKKEKILFFARKTDRASLFVQQMDVWFISGSTSKFYETAALLLILDLINWKKI